MPEKDKKPDHVPPANAEKPKSALEDLGLAPEEIDLLGRRKSQDVTLRQFMLVTELQTRVLVMKQMPMGQHRDGLLAESLALRDEVNAVDLETASLDALNRLNERLVKFNVRVSSAIREAKG